MEPLYFEWWKFIVGSILTIVGILVGIWKHKDSKKKEVPQFAFESPFVNADGSVQILARNRAAQKKGNLDIKWDDLLFSDATKPVLEGKWSFVPERIIKDKKYLTSGKHKVQFSIEGGLWSEELTVHIKEKETGARTQSTTNIYQKAAPVTQTKDSKPQPRKQPKESTTNTPPKSAAKSYQKPVSRVSEVQKQNKTQQQKTATAAKQNTETTQKIYKSASGLEWITPSESICKKFGAKFKDGHCKADWETALAICHAMGGRLPTIDELGNEVKKCGGELFAYNPDRSKILGTKNAKKSSYQKCYKRKGFAMFHYWSLSTHEENHDFALYVFFHYGYYNHYNKKDSRYVRCVRTKQ